MGLSLNDLIVTELDDEIKEWMERTGNDYVVMRVEFFLDDSPNILEADAE